MARLHSKDRGLFERPAGSDIWWIRFHDHLGKERRLKVGKKSLAVKAYKLKKEQVRQVKLGLLPADFFEEKRSTTLKDYLESIKPELEQKKSWCEDSRFFKRWIALLGAYPLDQISSSHAVKRRTAQLEKGLKPATINRETAFLKAMLFRAVRDGVLAKNPLEGFKLLPENNEHDIYLTEPQEARLEQVMAPEDFEVLAVAVDTGLRQSEQFRLAWTQVNFDDGWIVIQETKTEKGRSVPFTDRVERILRRRYACRKSPWVFPNQAGDRPRSSSSFYANVYLPALKAAELPHMTWHQAGRHTAGTRLAQRGVSEGLIQAILGHSSNRTTKRYIHHSPENLKAVIKVLNPPSSGKGGLSLVK